MASVWDRTFEGEISNSNVMVDGSGDGGDGGGASTLGEGGLPAHCPEVVTVAAEEGVCPESVVAWMLLSVACSTPLVLSSLPLIPDLTGLPFALLLCVWKKPFRLFCPPFEEAGGSVWLLSDFCFLTGCLAVADDFRFGAAGEALGGFP